jgi:hypothetical protein
MFIFMNSLSTRLYTTEGKMFLLIYKKILFGKIVRIVGGWNRLRIMSNGRLWY